MLRLQALETPWLLSGKQEAEMTLINDYTYLAMTDQRENDLARLAEQNWHIRQALSGRVSWWRKLLANRERSIRTADHRPVQRGMATPQHRVAH